ncbi:hypothetical protein HanXRQr2_Chr13g0580551 [Helianthus annuus]|uniref:Uncharacterized protein n=1 Tax=Helianthus annuus TaxID=4232 RepID=A0A9K3H9J3_HELAN|nr:hypothetical protein HanXRQr2_Chr13g0580551 [Helianthus annuus]KAJ0848544.1 hypothetical protein HanPSC8_Chr13g0558741 [Helianthus annuus]
MFRDLLNIHSSAGVSDQWKDAIQGLMIIRCWSIWKARNELKFQGKPVKIEIIISEIKTLEYLWFSKRSKYRNVS